MIRLYCTRFQHPFPSEVTRRLVASLGYDTGDLNRYRRWQDAQAHLLGRLLLNRGLALLGIDPVPPLRYTRYRRPYLDGPVDFSISHSGGYVLCAVATGCRLGVDVERIRPVALDSMQLSFSPDEWREITEAPRPHEQLFDYWTRKEAVVKADGRGLPVTERVVLEGTQGRLDNTVWFVYRLMIGPNYRSYVACSQPMNAAPTCTTVVFN